MKSDMQVTKHRKFVGLVLFVALGIFLYLGLLSVHYDLNGVTEARAIEQGDSSLFPPNHMLYRPLVWLIYQMLQAVGYRGLSILPAQVTTALFGALGLGLFYWWVCGLVNHKATAMIACLGFGTSWAYWVFSTDAFYIIPAATVTIGGLILLSVILASPGPHPSMTCLVGLGILCALSILLWQANVFFQPLLLIGLFAKYRRDTRRLFTAMTVFVATVSVLVGCAYLFVGIFVLEHRTVPSFMEWLLRYGARLPMWGRWEVVRLPKAAASFVGSLVPVWEGLGLRALLKGKFHPGKFLSQMSLLALALLLLLPPLRQLMKRTLSFSVYLLGWLVLGFVIYFPFIVWWDPFEPKWFVIPNIGLWAMLAVLWDSMTNRFRYAVLFAGLVLTVSIANFFVTIWPRHSEPNKLLQRAGCLAEHMEKEDLFVTIEWEWSGYVSYFFQRQVFSLIDASARYEGKDEAINLLQREVDLTHQRGGKVYILDVDTCPPEHLDWLASQTGLKQEDFQRFKRAPAFACDAVRFQELNEVR